MRSDLLAVFIGYLLERLLGDGQHSASAARAVVEQIRPRFDLVGHGQEHEAGHQLDRVAWRPVLARFLVIVLVEHPYQVFEDGPHAVVVKALQTTDRIGAEVNVLVEEFFDELTQAI